MASSDYTAFIMKHIAVPISISIICSLPDDLITGLFQKYMKDPAIKTTNVMPMIPNTINTIAHGSVISKQDSCMGTQLLLPSSGRLPHIFSGHTSQLVDNVEFV